MGPGAALESDVILRVVRRIARPAEPTEDPDAHTPEPLSPGSGSQRGQPRSAVADLNWQQLRERTRRLGSALAARDIGEGDTVAVMLPNTPAMVEAHYGVPLTRAVLNSINTRLDAATVAFILQHSDSKVVLVDREFSGVMAEALAMLRGAARRR